MSTEHWKTDDLGFRSWTREDQKPEWPWVHVSIEGVTDELRQAVRDSFSESVGSQVGQSNLWILCTELSPRYVAKAIADRAKGWPAMAEMLKPLLDGTVALYQKSWANLLIASLPFTDDWYQAIHAALKVDRAIPLDRLVSRAPVNGLVSGGRGEPDVSSLEQILRFMPGYAVTKLGRNETPLLVEISHHSADEWLSALEHLAADLDLRRDQTEAQERLKSMGFAPGLLADWEKQVGPVAALQPPADESAWHIISHARPSRIWEELVPLIGSFSWLAHAINGGIGDEIVDPIGRKITAEEIQSFIASHLGNVTRLAENHITSLRTIRHWLETLTKADLLEAMSKQFDEDSAINEENCLNLIKILIIEEQIIKNSTKWTKSRRIELNPHKYSRFSKIQKKRKPQRH